MSQASGVAHGDALQIVGRLAGPAGALGAVVFLLAPQAAPGLVVASAIFALANARLSSGQWQSLDTNRTWLALLPLTAWLVFSALRSPDAGNGLAALAAFIISVGCAIVCCQQISRFSDDAYRRMADGLVIGFVTATWLLMIDIATDLGLRRMFASVVPVLPHDYITWRDGWITALPAFISNKNMAAIMLLAWPVLLLTRGAERGSRAWWARIATIGAAVLAIFWSDHEASKLAIVVGTGVYLAARWSRLWTWRALGAGWVVATLLVVPISYGAYQLGAYKFDGLQYSGKHRLVIWGYTAGEVAKAPLLGKGLGATRAADEMTSKQGYAPGTSIKLGTNVHSHNVFLQMWHEAGLIGAVLLLIAGWPALAWLRRTDDVSAPYMMAAWVTAMVMAAVTWSMVAAWFIASFAFAALWAAFAVDGQRRARARTLGKAATPA